MGVSQVEICSSPGSPSTLFSHAMLLGMMVVQDTCCNTSTSHAGAIHYLVAIKLIIIQLLRVFGICVLPGDINCHLDF